MSEDWEEGGEGREERVESREYRHRHIDIDINQRRKKKERRFYVPNTFERTLSNLETILEREGSNLSRWIRDNAESYVRLHEPGNPQQRLDVIMKLGKAYHAPNPVCGFKDCLRDTVAVGVFVQSGKTYGLCEKHWKEAKEFGPKVWRFLK